jgi:hypothetical protein
MSFCARGKFWEKELHTHSPPYKCGRCVQQNTLTWGRARQSEINGMREGKGYLKNGGETTRNGLKR